MNTTHSPLPWKREEDLILDPSDYVLAVVQNNEDMEANAQFIVTACNSHAALLGALEELIAAYSWALRNGCRANIPEGIVLQQARQAIALANGVQS